MAKLTVPIEFPTRLCVVGYDVGWFHLWEHYSEPTPEGDVTSKVYGIVEFKDGVRRIDPVDIKFCDETTDYLNYIDQHEDMYLRILEGRVIDKHDRNQ